MSDSVTKVEVSFFKPTGYGYTLFVDTEDRGAAALRALKACTEFELPMLNYIKTDRVSRGRVRDDEKLLTLD